jgi:hypothetical protein
MTPRLPVLAISVVSLVRPSTQYQTDSAVMSRCKSVGIGIGERAFVKHQGEWISPVSGKLTYRAHADYHSRSQPTRSRMISGRSSGIPH